MRVWVTRTEPGAATTAERVRRLGYEPWVHPLLVVRPVPNVSFDLRGTSALAFTSRNGVTAFAERTEASEAWRVLPVFAVGAATARAAREVGFADVRSADGNVADLARLILDGVDPGGGVVFHAGARERAGDLGAHLRAGGLRLRSVVAYETIPGPPPTPEALAGLDAVLIHSPKAARVLASLTIDRQLCFPAEEAFPQPQADALSALPVLCISEAAAAPLRPRFREVRAASEPKEASLLALLGKPPGAG